MRHEVDEEDKDETYYPYIKQELHLHVVYEDTVYANRQGLIPMI